MERIDGNPQTPLLECVSPRRNRWRVRWDMQQQDDGSANYMEQRFDHQPTIEEIKSLVLGWYNDQVDQKILSGFTYENVPVWLSSENQFNYKAAYDLAVQTAGATLPITFKFGTDEEPVYRTFSDMTDFTSFYTASVAFVNTCLSEGWAAKDAIDWTVYG